jgi:hypothetical protein
MGTSACVTTHQRSGLEGPKKCSNGCSYMGHSRHQNNMFSLLRLDFLPSNFPCCLYKTD